VTEQAIRALVAGNWPLVAILWRRDAATLMLEGVPYLESAHRRCLRPGDSSASVRFPAPTNCSIQNELLDTVGAAPVDWRLP
jgi:uracil-DNA glycosylase